MSANEKYSYKTKFKLSYWSLSKCICTKVDIFHALLLHLLVIIMHGMQPLLRLVILYELNYILKYKNMLRMVNVMLCLS